MNFILKENDFFFWKFYYNILLSKWNLQNKLIIRQTCVEATLVVI